MKTTTPNLTALEKKAMRAVKDGADIFSPSLARTLREIENTHPELIKIVKAQGRYTVSDVHPYFGAILTAKGRYAVCGVYGCDVEVEVRVGMASTERKQFHFRGTEATCRRRAMMKRGVVRILSITPLGEEDYITAYGLNQRM